MHKHVKILGWLQIAMGIFDLLVGLLGFGALSTFGLMSGDAGGAGMMAVIGGAFGTLMIALALPNLICGIGLLKDWGGWVMVLAVILGFLNLLHFPLGTALAVYTFWIAWKIYGNASDDGSVTTPL